MADNEAEIVKEIQDKYVPFLKRLIAFLEKTNKASPDNLNKLKSIHTVFTTATVPEQIHVFQTNKKKLEKWHKNSQKEKMNEDEQATRGSKRNIVEDTDSSQGATETVAAKKSKVAEAVPENNTFNPKLIAQIKKEKMDAPRVSKPVMPVVPTPAPAPVPTPAPVVQAPPAVQAPPVAVVNSAPPDSNGDQITFTCASCQFQTLDEQEFMKHTRTDHRSDLSMWCKQCGKCFSNAGVLVSHIKERACTKEEMIYRCGVKDCTFETTSGQTFVHHLRHCHKGSPFIFCVHCQKIFTLPHCLILHMQDDCPYKDKNRRNPGQGPVNETQVIATPPPVRPQVVSFANQAPKIASVTSAVPRLSTPVVAPAPTPSPRGRGGLMPTARGRARGRGRGRGRPPSESSDSDDPDDPSWRPEEITGQQTLRRSGRWAKKVNDVINVEPKKPSRGISLSELNAKEMLRCPCCDFMAAFKSVLQDHYIANHKVPNKNACLVCHLKFESTQCFLDHFEDHASGKLSNKMVPEVATSASEKKKVASPVTVGEDNSNSGSAASTTPTVKNSDSSSLDQDTVGVVKSLSETTIINPTSDQSYVKIPYQAAIHDKNNKDSKLKKFEELKSPSDLVAMRTPDRLKCFFKCVLYNCTYTTDDGNDYFVHLDTMHKGKRLHCGYCLKEFFSGEGQMKHMVMEHSKRLYQCSNCFYRGYSKIHVQIHIKNHHNSDPNTEVFVCDPIKIPSDVTINSDVIECSNNTTWPFICAIGDCNFQSFDPKEFKVHNEMTHRCVSVFFCHYCKVDFISFKRLLNHYRLHGINTFQCHYCIHGSETKDEILLHLCNVHADQPLRAFMRGTEEDASSEATLLPFALGSDTANRMNIGSPRPDSPAIENEDKNRIDFESQMYEVVGETYYPKYVRKMCSDLICGVPFCLEKFENVLQYIGHLRHSHAASNFSCPHCPEVGNTWDDLKNHLLCHGSELYACGLMTCDFYDWDKTVVTEHLKSHGQSAAKVVIIREPAAGNEEDNDTSEVKSLPRSCPFNISDEYYQCFFCSYKSNDRKIMKLHMYSELRYRRFSCKLCDKKFIGRAGVKDHFIKTHPEQDVQCSVQPNPEIENIVQNILNQKMSTPSPKFSKCSNCNQNFKSVVQFQCHVCLCFQKHYQPYDCSYCKVGLSNFRLLKFHTEEKHYPKPADSAEVASAAVEEEICQKLQQNRLKYLKTTLGDKCPDSSQAPWFVKFYTCSLCNFESNHKFNAQNHTESSHKAETVEIKQELRNVGQPEATSSEVENSTKLPSEASDGVKRYRCGFCVKRVHSLTQLENHVEGLHPVRDEVEYSYYYLPDAKGSFSSDDKEKFECAYCKSGQENLDALKKHSDLMHTESPFKVRGYVVRNRHESLVMACGYCYQRVEGMSNLKRHMATQHPTWQSKFISGFKDVPSKRQLEEEDDLPNKKIKFGAIVFVCSHCGAAYPSQEQVRTHSKRAHTRLRLEFNKISLDSMAEEDVTFYKCEFCPFTGEKQYLDTHLMTKHKSRVTCGYCNKRFEFATRLREHHDLAHKGQSIKYVQETVVIKKERRDSGDSNPGTAGKRQVRNAGNQPKPKYSRESEPIDINNIYTYSNISGRSTRLSVLTYSKICDIYPKVILDDVMKKKV